MTDKQTAELKDKILLFLATGQSSSVREISEATRIPFDTVFALTGAISKDGYTESIDVTFKDKFDKLLTIRPEGRHFLSGGGYVELLRRESLARRTIAIADKIKIGLAIFSVFLSVILGWLKISTDQTIREKDREIEQLKHRIQQLESQK
jgi:hypothetical protein